MSVFGRAFVALALMVMAARPVAAQQESDYALRSGDKITITLYTGAGDEVPQVRGERIIDRTGDIFLPLIGPTLVAGSDQEGIRELVQSLYSEFYTGHVVQVKVELNVQVTGAVGDAGQFFVAPTTSIVGAINSAGGMTPELTAAGLTNIPSDQTRVRLVRDGVTTILNLRPDDISAEDLRRPVQSGDWIHVPNQARSRVRDEIQFWGGILSFVANLAAVMVLIGR
jgi:protein involved in polysaccharide export with SLBB domain